jgi:hypothetical protein
MGSRGQPPSGSTIRPRGLGSVDAVAGSTNAVVLPLLKEPEGASLLLQLLARWDAPQPPDLVCRSNEMQVRLTRFPFGVVTPSLGGEASS